VQIAGESVFGIGADDGGESKGGTSIERRGTPIGGRKRSRKDVACPSFH